MNTVRSKKKGKQYKIYVNDIYLGSIFKADFERLGIDAPESDDSNGTGVRARYPDSGRTYHSTGCDYSGADSGTNAVTAEKNRYGCYLSNP